MSNSKTAVSVAVADRAASVEILDGAFQVVAQGFGHIEAQLAPGLYKARASVGAAVQEKIFVVEKGAPTPPVVLEPVRFASPVPLEDTTTSHEYHQAAVAHALNKPPLILGGGAGLLLSVRDPSDVPFTQTSASLPDYARSFDGFRLCDATRHVLIDYDQAARRDLAHGYAVLNAELDPGGYVLKWAPPGQPAIARPLPLAPGWTTQVFVMVAAEGEAALPLRPLLADCAVQMAPLGSATYPREHFFRLAEIARQALLQGRNIIAGKELNALLAEKFGNPILGLLAAHLLLLDAAPRLPLLHIVLGNLGAMLGPDHPDVIALRLRLGQVEHPGQAPAAGEQVAFPPLLKASWEILARRAVLDDGFFPAGSLCRQMADRVVDNGVWLAWRPHPAPTVGSDLIAGLSDEELGRKKGRDRQRISEVIAQVGPAGGKGGLLETAGQLAKPLLREKLRKFMKSTAQLETEQIEPVKELLMRLARHLPWQQLIAKLTELDQQGAVSERLSSVQKALIPTLLMLRQQLDAGQELDAEQWARVAASLQVPRAVLLENLRDLARLAGGMALRLIEEQRKD
ncbi:MAG: hypothetical protein R6W95_04110 [Desulfosarcina sp.]